MSVPTLSSVGRAVRLGVLVIPSLGAAAPALAADPALLYERTSYQLRLASQQLCEVAGPYARAPGWSVLHGHAVNVVATLDRLDQALAYGDLRTARLLADQLEEIGECADDVADDLDDWVCPRTPGHLYRQRLRAAEDLADFIESRTDRLRRVVRTFRPAIGGGCPLSGGGAFLNRNPLGPAPLGPTPLPNPVVPLSPNRPLPPAPGTLSPAPLGPALPAPTLGPAAGWNRNPILAARFGNRGGRFGSQERLRGGRFDRGVHRYRFGF